MKLVKNLVKNSAAKAGYQIKRTSRAAEYLNNDTTSETTGWIIDFVGPSGVGKTTLFNKIYFNYENGWLSRSQLESVYWRKLKKPLKMIDEDAEKIYRYFLKNKFNKFISRDNFSFYEKIELNDFCLRQIAVDACIKNNRLSKGLFSDDGLTHNFTNEIIDIAKEKKGCYKKSLKWLFNKRAIIHLTASPDFILNNLECRNTEHPGYVNNWYARYNPAELSNLVKEAVVKNKELISLAKKLNVKILELNAEENLKKNKNSNISICKQFNQVI